MHNSLSSLIHRLSMYYTYGVYCLFFLVQRLLCHMSADHEVNYQVGGLEELLGIIESGAKLKASSNAQGKQLAVIEVIIQF